VETLILTAAGVALVAVFVVAWFGFRRASVPVVELRGGKIIGVGLAVVPPPCKCCRPFLCEKYLKGWRVQTRDATPTPWSAAEVRRNGSFLEYYRESGGGCTAVVHVDQGEGLSLWRALFYFRGLECGGCGESFEKTAAGSCGCFVRRDAGS